MEDTLDAVTASQVESEIKAIMRKHGIAIVCVKDEANQGGLRFWSMGGNKVFLVHDAELPQYAIVQTPYLQKAA